MFIYLCSFMISGQIRCFPSVNTGHPGVGVVLSHQLVSVQKIISRVGTVPKIGVADWKNPKVELKHCPTGL